MNKRGRWQGIQTIARLNWPFFAVAVPGLIVAVAVAVMAQNELLRLLCALAAAGFLWFLAGSIIVSHLVYDRSDLYRWRWLERALRGVSAERVIFCHAGFDEASAHLRDQLAPKSWLLLDHYDPARMTEPSIQRARRLFPLPAETKAAPFGCWPAEAARADGIFGLLAIHELRSEDERVAWFAEARRCLAPGGRVLLVEHTRDVANFFAFGPGFWHFHSPANWRRCWMRAGLSLHDEFRITPWVRVFVLTAQ